MKVDLADFIDYIFVFERNEAETYIAEEKIDGVALKLGAATNLPNGFNNAKRELSSPPHGREMYRSTRPPQAR